MVPLLVQGWAVCEFTNFSDPKTVSLSVRAVTHLRLSCLWDVKNKITDVKDSREGMRTGKDFHCWHWTSNMRGRLEKISHFMNWSNKLTTLK
jgi:hypothetical protein